MEEGGDDRVKLRRPRVWGYASVAMAVVGAGIVVSLLLAHGRQKAHGAGVAKVLEVLDAGYVACVLGQPVPDAQLAPKLLEAEMSGSLTARRVRACSELAEQKLAALESLKRDDPALDVFWPRPFTSDGGDYGVCGHLELVRTAANDLGVKVPPPHCSTKIDQLTPVVRDLPVMYHGRAFDDELVIQWPDDQHRSSVRRTKDGASWDESEQIATFYEMTLARDGVWAIADDGHLAVLDGRRWLTGLVIPGRWAIQARRTSAGWTLVVQTDDDGAAVVHLDETMHRVLGKTVIPALRKRWENWMAARAAVAPDGTAAAFDVRVHGDGIELASYVVHPDGKLDPPRITQLPAHGSEIETIDCQAPGATYLAIAGAGIVVTRDGGATFTVLRGGDAVMPKVIACSDNHFLGVGDGHLVFCDQSACRSGAVPARSGASFETRVAMRGESGRILVTDGDYAVLYRAEPGSEAPALAKVWRWPGIPIPSVVRAEDTWFFMD